MTYLVPDGGYKRIRNYLANSGGTILSENIIEIKVTYKQLGAACMGQVFSEKYIMSILDSLKHEGFVLSYNNNRIVVDTSVKLSVSKEPCLTRRELDTVVRNFAIKHNGDGFLIIAAHREWRRRNGKIPLI